MKVDPGKVSNEIILDFVRGDKSWKVLEKAGMRVEVTDGGYQIDNPCDLVVKVCPRDVAHGLLAHYQKPEQMSRWAGIILSGS